MTLIVIKQIKHITKEKKSQKDIIQWLYMQKRVEKKGGDYGVTGGHPKSGETPIEGIISEVKEELGLDFSNEKFTEYDSGCDGKDCYKMYFVNKDFDLN